MEKRIDLRAIWYFKEGYNKDITEQEAAEAIIAMKMFLLSHCRKNSRVFNSICCMSLGNMSNCCGLFERLVYYPEKKRCIYIPGQDYSAEIKALKDLVIKYCC